MREEQGSAAPRRSATPYPALPGPPLTRCQGSVGVSGLPAPGLAWRNVDDTCRRGRRRGGVVTRRSSPPGETAEALCDGPLPRAHEQRRRQDSEETRQRLLDVVRGCARIALARAGPPPLSAPHPSADLAAHSSLSTGPAGATAHAAAGSSDAPRIVHPAVPWAELVGSAKESVRQTWLPMVGRMIGLDDSAVRAVSVADGTGPRPPSERLAKAPAAQP